MFVLGNYSFLVTCSVSWRRPSLLVRERCYIFVHMTSFCGYKDYCQKFQLQIYLRGMSKSEDIFCSENKPGVSLLQVTYQKINERNTSLPLRITSLRSSADICNQNFSCILTVINASMFFCQLTVRS